VISEITDSFRQNYGELAPDLKISVKRAYKLWLKNTHHPSLHFKKIHDQEPIWSVRVSKNYRVIGVMRDEKMIWFFVGTHAQYDKIIKKL
jgi:hypothetical protein